jgi:hypothetical protein
MKHVFSIPLGWIRRTSKLEWAICVVIVACLFSLLCWPAHWRTTASDSCHVCGNRQQIVREFRWWRLDSQRTERVTDFPVPTGHQHDWYRNGYSSNGSPAFADSKPYRYRDGRTDWSP